VAAIEALKESLAAYVTVEQLNAALQQGKATVEVALSGKASNEDLKALEDALNDQIATIKANIAAFEDQLKDYAKTADVKSLIAAATKNLVDQEYVNKALATALASYVTASDLNKALSEYAKTKDLEAYAKVADLAAYAKESDVKKALEDLQKSLVVYAKADDLKNYLTTAAFEEFKKSLEDVARKSDLTNFVTTDDLAAAGYATSDQLTELAKKLETLSKNMAALGDAEKVKDLTEEVAKIATMEYDIKELQNKVAAAQTAAQVQDAIKSADAKVRKDLGDAINILTIGLEKRLGSVILKPGFYWEGLEAIEAPCLKTPVFVPVQKDYKFKYEVTNTTLGVKEVNVTVKEVMSSPLVQAIDGKSYIVLEGCTGETMSNGAAWIAKVWPTVDDKSLTAADIDAAVTSYNAKAVAKYKDITRPIYANYHINPATTKLEGAELSFFENDAEVYTRGNNGAIGATPVEPIYKKDGKNEFNNGILKVPFTVKSGVVLSMFQAWAKSSDAHIAEDVAWDTDGHAAFGAGKTLPFLALQVATKDTTITSDYAVVVPAKYTIIALADKNPDVALDQKTFLGPDAHATKVRFNHLYESVGYNTAKDHSDGVSYNLGAIPMPATHKVRFDSCINLKPLIATHYMYQTYTKYGTSDKVCKLMTDADMEALGLHYEFTPITYITDINVTDQSAHIVQIDGNMGKETTDKKSGWFAPRSVTDKGETIHNKVATREVIDREPLIRVDLVDSEGEIIRYGYIKLRITEDAAEEVVKNYYAEFEFEMWMNCGDEARVTWAQMENKILAQLNNGKGLTKKEFEKFYYMQNEGKYEVMPADKDGVTDPTSPSGKLYADAQANKWWAVRYAAADAKKLAETDWTKFTATNNQFGRVWYTPHDNSTDAHAWDENTNVIIWNLYPGFDGATKETGGNMTAEWYKKMIAVSEASFDSKGNSTKDVTTVIRFIHKIDGSSLFVTLKIPAGKLHFEYAGIGNKDWSHWWKMNTQKAGKSGSLKPYWDELDVHANTPVPAANAYKALDVKQFEQDLYDYWKNKEILDLGDKTHFSKFYAPSGVAPVATFEFTTPQAGVNTTATAAVNGEWTVSGISGVKWTLKLTHNNKAISAVKKDGKVYGPEVVCYLSDALDSYAITTTDGSVIHYNGLEDADPELYPAATDLLNKSGRYNAYGDPRYTKSDDATEATMGILKDAAYLEKDQEETFTAYLKINVTHDCYDPLMGMNYFNVRFLRPINVAAKDYRVRDVLNKMQRIMISDLIDIIDYRDIPVVPYYATSAIDQVFYYGSSKFKAPKYIDVTPDNGLTVKEQNKGVPYEYYGITDLAVYYDQIRTDHDQEYTVRVANDKLGAKIPVADVVKLTKVKDLSSLASELTGSKPARVVSLYSNLSTIHPLAAYNGTPMNKDTQWDTASYLVTGDGEYSKNIGKIEYTNNSGITQLFHIYVPIAIRYNWGNIRLDEVFGKPAKLDKNYTQTVWAVITVDPSYKSGSGEE
jgi:tetratricopeptide (TPR) repeat protein